MMTSIIFAATVGTGLLWLMHAVAQQRREQQYDAMLTAMKKISIATQTGEGLETACSNIEGKAAKYVKRVFSLSKKMPFEQAMLQAATNKQRYLVEMLVHAAKSSNPSTNLRRLADTLATIRHDEKRIHDKANNAVTTIYLLVMLMPALWYALAGLLSTETLVITITNAMLIFFAMQIMVVSTAGIIIFKDWKNTMLTALFGILLVLTYALLFGPVIQEAMTL